jgi:hypothetical protein
VAIATYIFTNVAREMFQWKMWQERHSSGKHGNCDIHLHKRGKSDVNVAREMFQWKTWQERRSSGKRGKSDVNVARATLSGNMILFFL